MTPFGRSGSAREKKASHEARKHCYCVRVPYGLQLSMAVTRVVIFVCDYHNYVCVSGQQRCRDRRRNQVSKSKNKRISCKINVRGIVFEVIRTVFGETTDRTGTYFGTSPTDGAVEPTETFRGGRDNDTAGDIKQLTKKRRPEKARVSGQQDHTHSEQSVPEPPSAKH